METVLTRKIAALVNCTNAKTNYAYVYLTSDFISENNDGALSVAKAQVMQFLLALT